jgi:hypothetical protein
MTSPFSKPKTLTLPEVLRSHSAGGWLAEGLTRLYAVEEVARRYDGHFPHLDVGPSTARSVRIKGQFTFAASMGARHRVSQDRRKRVTKLSTEPFADALVWMEIPNGTYLDNRVIFA